ncbi:MAG: hypothetical protein ABIG66_02650 [Candidatus Kerfeldbacteria bacterium]
MDERSIPGFIPEAKAEKAEALDFADMELSQLEWTQGEQRVEDGKETIPFQTESDIEVQDEDEKKTVRMKCEAEVLRKEGSKEVDEIHYRYGVGDGEKEAFWAMIALRAHFDLKAPDINTNHPDYEGLVAQTNLQREDKDAPVLPKDFGISFYQKMLAHIDALSEKQPILHRVQMHPKVEKADPKEWWRNKFGPAVADYEDVDDITMEKLYSKQEQVLIKEFAQLREKTLAEVEMETEARIASNPTPTEEEIRVGAFREMIEPQIRDALFEIARKGYSTESSGFWGGHGEIQCLDGLMELDEETAHAIRQLGMEVEIGPIESEPGRSEQFAKISFRPPNPDMAYMKKMWDHLAEALPDRGHPASPSTSGGSDDFRETYAPGRTDIEKEVLKGRLQKEEYHPDVEAEMRRRLEELGG